MKKLTNKQVLEKAVKKAVKDGFNPIDDMGEVDKIKVWPDCFMIGFYTKHGDGGQYWLYRLLYDIEIGFAKYFFGEENTNIKVLEMEFHNGEKVKVFLRKWEYHLQRMVLYENPIDYLRKFVK